MHAFANPKRFLELAKSLTQWCGLMAFCLIGIGCYGGLVLAPPDYLQGESVRIIYIHVPSAWLGMAGWSGIAAASLAQLVWRHPLAGVAARAVAVPGAVFTALCLATGSLWGRPTWGTYWQWDGRMTSVLIMLFLYFGYIGLANAGDDRVSVSRTTAIFGLVGAINLPIIHYSVVWWNTLHQPNGSKIAASIGWPLGFTLSGFTLLFIAIVLMRMRTFIARNKLEARMLRMARG